MFDYVLRSGDPELLPRLLAATGITVTLGSVLFLVVASVGGFRAGASAPDAPSVVQCVFDAATR